MIGWSTSLIHTISQSSLAEELSTYSPNERMTLVIRGLLGLALVISIATIWFVWATRKSKRSHEGSTARAVARKDPFEQGESQAVHHDETVD